MKPAADRRSGSVNTPVGEGIILPEPPMSEDEICRHLRDIRLPFIADEFRRIVNRPEFEESSPKRVLFHLLRTETQRRENNRVSADIKRAEFKYPQASLDISLNDPERRLDQAVISRLVLMEWADDATNVVITGLTGSGKTHLACALGIKAVLNGKKVRYCHAASFNRELQRKELEGALDSAIAKAAKWDILIIDDFGLMKLDIDMCRNLFEVIERRDRRKATIVVSQYPVKSWYDMFQDATYAEALLDRLVQQAIRVDMQGINLRKNPPKIEASL